MLNTVVAPPWTDPQVPCSHTKRAIRLAEEYCWAITQAAGRSCCGRSGSSVLEFGYQLDSLVCTYIYSWPYSYVYSVTACAGPSVTIYIMFFRQRYNGYLRTILPSSRTLRRVIW